MSQDKTINTKEYWENRFNQDWEACEGRKQSRFFGQLAMDHMPEWLMRHIRLQKLSICDWGCAEGDGTDVLAQFFGQPAVTGVDIAPSAVQKAREYYPEIEFVAEDFLSGAIDRSFGVVFSSNTLEHFSTPWEVFIKISRYASQFVVLLVPYREFERHPEHEVTFDLRNIPFCPIPEWALIFSRVIKASELNPSFYPGCQVLLVYGRMSTLAELDFMLSDISLKEDDWVDRCQILMSERDKVIAEYDAYSLEKEARIKTLLLERDNAYAERDHYASLYNYMIGTRSWKITQPLRIASSMVRFLRRKTISTIELLTQKYQRSRLLVKHLGGLNALGRRHPAPISGPSSCSSEQQKKELHIAMLVENFHEGGLERVVIDLCCELRKLGVTTTILVAGEGGRCSEEARALGISVTEFNHSLSNFRAFLQRVRPALLFAHHSYFGLHLLSEMGVQVVEVLHNAYHWQKGCLDIERERQKNIHSYVAVSEFVRDYCVINLHIPSEKTTVIHNGLNPMGLFRPPVPLMNAKRLAALSSPKIVHLANFHEQKNQRLVITAFSLMHNKFPTAKLSLVGAFSSNPSLHESVVSDIQSHGLRDFITLTGPLNRRELSRLLAEAHVAVLPSSLEGFSIASLEYAYFGLPSILSRTGAAEFLISQFGHGILVDFPSIAPEQLCPARVSECSSLQDHEAAREIAHALESILHDYNFFIQRGADAAQSFHSYSIENTAKEYFKMIQGLSIPAESYHGESCHVAC